ncbi:MULTISPECIES: hypothetical protein [unclassified Streptomyces]|uniref:hypothetical protein n=1 Tax=unclassified Streptomyces TaxID=2593676 RepID=UPI00247548E6|nr:MULTISPECIES: hypothetical protein [unclassified Streptomyces]MDH6449427.1 hypothetical protein [Streptomyces sp. SAI-119]MDH6499991.1 hypothetical protein [Streptomyces sp. SAI-149]
MNEEVNEKIRELKAEVYRKRLLDELQIAAQRFERLGYKVTISITPVDTETEENK